MVGTLMEMQRHGGIMSHVPEGWFTVSEAALAVGRSPQRLKALRKTETIVPSGHMTVGKSEMLVYLYSEDDISRLRDYFAGAFGEDNKEESS